MMLESLLLSGDREVVRILRPTLENMAIQVEICDEAKKAGEILCAEKFDAVIVDCDDLQGGREVLQGLRGTPSNKNSVTFALLNGKKTTTQEAFEMGVNFVLQKPLSPLNALRCFGAALNFMVRERRRYYRLPLKMAVRVVLDEIEWQATSTNISEGGIAVMMQKAIPKSGKPRLKFQLPETNEAFDVECEVAWADVKGHVGLKFLNVPGSSQEQLEQWLNAQVEELSPVQEEIAGSNSKLSR